MAIIIAIILCMHESLIRQQTIVNESIQEVPSKRVVIIHIATVVVHIQQYPTDASAVVKANLKK